MQSLRSRSPRRGKPEVMVLVRFNSLRCIFLIALLALISGNASAQQGGEAWFRTGTGIGVDKIRLAVADFGPRAENAKTHSQQFTQVVRDDLAFSGILDLVSPSFYPSQLLTQPGELQNAAWTDPQVNAHYVAFGNITETASEVAIQAWMYDVTSPSSQSVVGKIYRGNPTDAQVRKFAHQFAEIGRAHV